MDAVCRTCLTLGDLSPIFSSPNQHEHYTAALFITTGLKIELNDGFPQGICSNCTDLVNSTLRLRDQSHHAQQILLEYGFKKVIRSSKRAYNTLANIGSEEICENNLNNEKDITSEIKKENKFITTIDISGASHILERDCADIFSVKAEELANKTERVKRKYVRRKKETEAVVLDVDATEFGNSGNNITGDINEFGNNDEFGNISNPGKNEDKNKANTEKQVKQKKNETKQNKEKKHRPTDSAVQKKYYDLVEGKYNPKGDNTCSICKKIFKRCSSFVNHVKRHYADFVCEQCGQRFKCKYTLENHCMRRHGAERKLQCDQCTYKAVDRPQLTSHISRAHTGARPFVCDVCSASFSCKPNLRQHLRVHFAVKSTQCDQCPSMFTSRSALSTHTAKCHRMNFTYFCYLCPRRYNGRCSVRKHIARQHDIARHLQGPIRSAKWAKNESPPPEVNDPPVIKVMLKNT